MFSLISFRAIQTGAVDVSINHAPRFDNARAAGSKENIPDIIQFQTLHDFNYYMDRGLLDAYKTALFVNSFTAKRKILI